MRELCDSGECVMDWFPMGCGTEPMMLLLVGMLLLLGLLLILGLLD